MAASIWRSTLLAVFTTLGIQALLYIAILEALIMVPSLQAHVLYLHRVTLTWFKNLNAPEQFGFLHNQATPFNITTEDGIRLHAWHMLPLGVYIRNADKLIKEDRSIPRPTNIAKTLNFRLLRDDPQARLVIYFHGTSGTLASGWRPDSYRALYSGAPDKIHILTFDYRGYGLSSGEPTEPGLLRDASAVFDWATKVAGISPDRIVIFGQSLGSAVSIALANRLAAQSPEISCAGLVITASFLDVATLTTTYRIGGVIPVLSPIAKIPPLFAYFTRHLHSTWLNKDRIAEFVKTSNHYHIAFIHAEDDPDIPSTHTEVLFWNAINAASEKRVSFEALEQAKKERRTALGEGGWYINWPTEKGFIRLNMLKYGVHDKIMSYPVVGTAVLKASQAADPDFQK